MAHECFHGVQESILAEIHRGSTRLDGGRGAAALRQKPPQGVTRCYKFSAYKDWAARAARTARPRSMTDMA